MRRVLALVLLLPPLALAGLAALAQDWPVALGTLAVLAAVLACVRLAGPAARWAEAVPGRSSLLLGAGCLVLGAWTVWQLATGFRPEGRLGTAWVTGPLCLLLAPAALRLAWKERSGSGRRAPKG